MKDELVQLVFSVFAIVIAAALEEVCPSFSGVGFPWLLALVMVLAPRSNVLPAVMVAVGAGAFEDALASLPPLTSVSFFIVAALLSRKAFFPRSFLIVFFPVFAGWASLCAPGPFGDGFVRVFVSLPLGALAFAVAQLILVWCWGKVGLDE